MPLKAVGSVRARFRVWFSRVSAARKASRSASRGSKLPGARRADQEVDHGITVLVELDRDALTEPAEAANRPTCELCRRRRGGAQHDGTAEPDALEPLPHDPRLEGFEIDDNVGELGHESGKFTTSTP